MMTDTSTRPTHLAAEPRDRAVRDDIPAWKHLADDIEEAESSFSSAVQDLTDLLDRFEWQDDVPEGVAEAAEDLGLAVYGAAADVDRRLDRLREAVASAVSGGDETNE